jgi:hypothetical protein
MDADTLNYVSGEEVHAGDRVQHKGTYATVVFVSNGTTEEYLPGYEDQVGAERGIMINDDDGVTTSLGEPDESLQFIDRG